jgi:signal transduction histidine kinase
MTLLSSLRGRIFLASAMLAILSIGVALYLVNVRVTREAEVELERQIRATGALVDQLRTSRTETFTVMARLIADLPKLKAAVATNDPPTVQDIARGYREQLRANLLLVTGRTGRVLYAEGSPLGQNALASRQPPVLDALQGHESLAMLPEPGGILQVVTVPITIYETRPELLGSLSVGFLLDDVFARQLKMITGSDVAFGMNGRILASTRPPEEYGRLAEHLGDGGISHVPLRGGEFEALARRLPSASDAAGPVALILRSRTDQLRSLQAIHAGLAATALLAIVLATILSYAVARTITRPLAALTTVMREVAATGDLTRKIALKPTGRWDDEDARLLASTFDTLTESVARAHREISQKERLSALGGLSTVIAHEIRNPLMIIKAALHTLAKQDASRDEVREAVADIDEEVVRLNRIVTDVLDFSRPITPERVPTDLNVLARESATAAEAAEPGPRVSVAIDPALGQVSTDPERLRQALVNMLVNARHAVQEAARAGETPGAAGAAVEIRTERADGHAAVIVADRGVGIEPLNLAHIFDPYFTTKRGGTGLGLAIAKNIVEGLGGTIVATSVPGRGSEFRVRLPYTS